MCSCTRFSISRISDVGVESEIWSTPLSESLIEHRFTCPYCWESITMLLDLSIANQSYVEDCEVCCNPVVLSFRVENDAIVEFDAEQSP